jgi:DNA helicase-2/ATP-dependent DNA helicase PcrA
VTDGSDDLLSGLTQAQRAAVVSEAAPLAIVAAAGAGKTRVLTRRIAYRCRTGSAGAAHTLALTFTRKAAGELQHRLSALGLREGVAAGTFHSHATAQLQRWWADRRRPPAGLLDRKSRILGPVVAGRPGLEGLALSEIASIIEWAKARAVAPDELEAALQAAGRLPPGGRSGVALGADLAAVFARYEHEKERRGVVDFDDLLSKCADAIERDPEFAAAQRWCWRHIYVDEFQDMNPLQYRLLRAWLGPRVDLTVVGDPNQAIYGWNGADPSLLERFGSEWPSAEVLRLDANHRSTSSIVAVAASVLGPAGSALTATGRPGTVPVVAEYESEIAEARGIASALVAAHAAGRPWSSMAVLTRTNSQLGVISDALSLAGVPWWSAASAALLDQPAVRTAMADLRPLRSRPLRQAVADLLESLGAPGLDDETRSGLAALVETGRTLIASRPESTIGDWLAWLPAGTRDRSDGRPRGSDAVTLSSFHRAKGLEWPSVWVAGVEEGLVPMGQARSGPAEAEERRVLYVALTRAVEELHVSWASTRSFGAKAVARRPSRWLADIASACAALLDGPDGGRSPSDLGGRSPRQSFDAQREALRRTIAAAARPEDDPAVRDRRRRLTAWRKEAARHSGVPPKVLLHDATLNAIAAAAPATAEELLAMPGFGPVKATRYGPVILDLLVDRSASA